MKKLVYLLVITVASISMLAQQPPAKTADQAQTATATQPLPPDAASREKILKLFEMLDVQKTSQVGMQAAFQQGIASAEQMFRQQNPTATPEELKKFRDSMNDSMNDIMSSMHLDQMFEAMVPIYQRHFTDADIDSILAFYASPAGHKFLHETPQIVQESIVAMAPIQQQMMKDMTDKMNERIKKMKDSEEQEKKKPSGTPKSSH
jgi:uncharacterized protein